MYNLYLIKDRKKLLLLSSKSEKEVDRFLTNFMNEEDFLDRFEIDKTNRLAYEKSSKKGNERVPFLSYKYKDLFSSIDNYYYFLQVSNYNREVLDYFFSNEEEKYINNTNPFLVSKSNVLYNIRKTMFDNTYSIYKLAKLMNIYFSGMYSNFKSFYMYLINNGFEPKMKPFDDFNYNGTFEKVEEKLKEGKFEKIVIPDAPIDETLNDINYIVSKNIDIDKTMSEIDILTDKYSDEKKLSLLNKNWL